MNRYFRIEKAIHLYKDSDGLFLECICLVEDNRKQRLYINTKVLAERLEATWNRIKRKSTLIQGVSVGFGKQDHYDSDVDVYDVPGFFIKRGLRKAKDSSWSTGSIPKEWDMRVGFKIKNTKTIKPLMLCIEECIYLDSSEKKSVEKELRKVLQGKANGKSIYLDE